MTVRTNLLNLGFDGLKDFMDSIDEPRYRAQQMVSWVHQRQVTDFAEMTNLSKSLRGKLTEMAEVRVPEIALERESADGTWKWLMRLEDGNAIETVFIPERGRGTLCVSSQVGCALNCSFCATGKEGFSRNLSLSEIIGQVWLAKKQLSAHDELRLTNVVMMGMGEPLLNYDPVVEAMHLMLDDHAYGLSKYRVTLSTSGLIPAIEKLRADIPVSLAVSLHAPTNELRNQLVPLNKKYPLEQLIPICRDYYRDEPRRMVTFEYVMLAGINDTIADADRLVDLLSDVSCKVNLIPFNPFPKTQYICSTPKVIEQFRQTLLAAGMNAWTRKTRGGDIEGACGQLAGEVEDRTGRHERWVRTGKLIPEPAVISGEGSL